MNIPDSALPWLVLHRTDCKTTQDYADSVRSDFAGLLPHLPDHVDSILDIGCGLAGIDVLLKWHYPDARLILLDGDGPESNFRGNYGATMRPFNSRAVANELLAANGVAADEWKDVGTQETLKADLAISLLSLGWHYPLDTYKVDAKTIICDLREAKGRILSTIVYKGRHKGFRCMLNG